jgi:hypothetical protein
VDRGAGDVCGGERHGRPIEPSFEPGPSGHVAIPRSVKHGPVGRGHLGVVEHQHVVGVDVEAGGREVGRAGQHFSGSVLARSDQHLVVAVAPEVAPLDLAPGQRDEPLRKLVFGLTPARRWWLCVVVQRSVVEDDAGAGGQRGVEKAREDRRLVQVVGKHVQRHVRVGSNLVQQLEDEWSCGEAEPAMLILEGEAGAIGGDTRDLRGVPHELRVVGLKRRFRAEVVGVRLGLDEPPGEADPQTALAKRRHLDRQAGAQGMVDRRHRPVDEVAGRHGVGVPTQVGLKPLVHQDRDGAPSERRETAS